MRQVRRFRDPGPPPTGGCRRGAGPQHHAPANAPPSAGDDRHVRLGFHGLPPLFPSRQLMGSRRSGNRAACGRPGDPIPNRTTARRNPAMPNHLQLDFGLFGRLRRDAGAAWDALRGPPLRPRPRRRHAAPAGVPALPETGLPVPDPVRPRLRPGRLQERHAGRTARRRSRRHRHRRRRDAAACRLLRRMGPDRGRHAGRARGAGNHRLHPLRAGTRPRRRPPRSRRRADPLYFRLCRDRSLVCEPIPQPEPRATPTPPGSTPTPAPTMSPSPPTRSTRWTAMGQARGAATATPTCSPPFVAATRLEAAFWDMGWSAGSGGC